MSNGWGFRCMLHTRLAHFIDSRVTLWRALAPGFHPGAIVFILMYLNFIMKIYILLKKVFQRH